MKNFSIFFMIILLSCSGNVLNMKKNNVLKDKVICIDPGHGGTAATDNFRVGIDGEREEWIDLRVALILEDILINEGAKVLITRTKDIEVQLKDRALLAVDNKADVFLSIHHNATADRTANFPIIYYHANASENQASVELAKILALKFREKMFNGKGNVSIASDHTIFPESGTAVLRHSYGIPGVIGEASFFSNPKEEVKLKTPEYNRLEAEAYLETLKEFFSESYPEIKLKNSTVSIKPFKVLQEAQRSNNEALKWEENFYKGKEIYDKIFHKNKPSNLELDIKSRQMLEEAYSLFSLSAQYFPDSYLARECHLYRADILDLLDKKEDAVNEYARVREYYVPLNLK